MNSGGEKERSEIKNLFLYATGKAISLFGTTIFNFALGFYVLKMTGSALSFAVTLILGIIPMIIINPFAGVIADKFDKKVLVVSMELLNGILLVFVYVICINYEFNLLIIYTTTFFMTIFTTFYGIALEAAKPNLVSERMLMNINSISKIIDSISSIMAPMLGGVVFAIFDIKTFIIVNGVCFILSGLSMLAIDFQLFKQHSNDDNLGDKIHFIKEIKSGFHYFFNNKKIKDLFTILISVNFFLGFAITVPLPYIINTILELDSKEFGIIQGAFPVGMILGALFVKKVIERISFSILLNYLSYSLSLFMIISGVPVILKSLEVHSFAYVYFYIALMFFLGVVVAFIDIPMSYILQTEIPDEYRGRVLGIGLSIGKMLLPIAMIVSGVLLNHIPSYVLPIVGGIVFLLINIRSSKKVEIEI